MSNFNGDELQEQATPQPEEQWKGVEEYDDQLIVNNDDSTEVYYHALSQKYDYTKNGWTQHANRNNISIVELNHEELEKVHRVFAKARRFVWMEKANAVIEIDRWGSWDEPKQKFSKPNEFALPMATTKGQRNAYKAHLSGHSEINQKKLEEVFRAQNNGMSGPEAAAKNPKGNRGGGQQRSQQQSSQQESQRLPQDSPPSSPESNGKTPKNYYEKKVAEMWATYTEVKELLAQIGIGQDEFKNGLYARFKTDSTTKMTAEQHLDVSKALKFVATDGTQFAQWIRDMGTPPPEKVNEDDLPFGDDKPYPKSTDAPNVDYVKSELEDKTVEELKRLSNSYIDKREPQLKNIGVERHDFIMGTYFHFGMTPDDHRPLEKDELIEVIMSLSYSTFPEWVHAIRGPKDTESEEL